MNNVNNHYKWLEENLPSFFEKLGINFKTEPGIIVSHGDKCYGYKNSFEAAGIPFEKGVAIYLLTYISPFSEEVRETKNGFVKPLDWIIENKDRFMPYFETKTNKS